MRHHGQALSVNISIMFTEHPYLERFAAARDAGFDNVETWWPFSSPVPQAAAVDAWLAAAEAAGVSVDAINFHAGDMPAGERGVCALPERHPELSASLPTLHSLAVATGCTKFNLLYGQPSTPDHAEPAAQAYRAAARAVETIGGTVLLEPLASGLNGSYPLLTMIDIETFATDHLADLDNLRLLLDTFHLGMNGVDPADAFDCSLPVGHVQIADPPSRGEPGSGTLDWDRFFAAVTDSGYRGMVGCEYRPTTTTTDSLGWIRP
ncbi:MAG TPA: TIM barrel protein [Microlunatus sp.]